VCSLTYDCYRRDPLGAPLALPPLVFALDDVDAIISSLQDSQTRALYPGMVFVGGNGGLERIAFDTRGPEPPWPIVMMDPVAGNESAVTIARDFAEFVDAVDRSLPDQHGP
jgi:hypothetical protein